MLKSPKYDFVVEATKSPKFVVKNYFKIPVTTKEYMNRKEYIPELYKGPNIWKRQAEYYQQDMISEKLPEVIIFRHN